MPHLQRIRRRSRALIAAVLAAVGALVLSGSALAAQDELAGGTVTLQLKSSKKLKLKPRTVNLAIIGGRLDPVTGDGTVNTAGKFRAKRKGGKRKKKRGGASAAKRKKKRGKGKTKVRVVSLNFGANGGPGTIDARVAGDRVNGFGTLSGGTTTRAGFGAQITGVTARISGKGAKALRSAFNKRKKKKKGKRGGASAAKRKKGKRKKGKGAPLGTVSATTVPRTVEVLPGGTLTLHTNVGLLSKLAAHCIDATPPPGAAGAFPVPPATQDPVTAGAAFHFPVTGGELAPALNEGKVNTAGGQGLVKNNGPLVTLLYPFSTCAGTPPGVGATLLQTKFSPDFTTNLLKADAGLPNGGSVPQAPVALINFSTGTKQLNGNQVTVTGATVTFHPLAVQTLNMEFPNRSGDPNQNLTTADVLGTIDLTATLR